MAVSSPPERAVEILHTMLRMRRLEEQVLHFAYDYKGLLRGHYHVYIGQEASGAGALAAVGLQDYVFTTHRNHGHVTARGADPGRVLAEIIGRADGYCKGRAGTFHVAAPDLGILHTSAVVGGCVALAAGAAHGVKLQGGGRATLAFFGDGSMEEGSFCETMNIAQLWRLPVIFLVDNNSVSAEERPGRGSPTSEHAASALTDVPKAFNVDSRAIDGTDVELVYRTVSELAARVRAGDGPFFIESRTTRWPGNYGAFPKAVGGDTDIAWTWAPENAPEVVRRWEHDSDPVLLFARRLLADGILSRDQLIALDRQAQEEIKQAAEFALNSPLPAPEAALEHAYA